MFDTDEVRRARQDLVKLAKPQEGVDALKDKFKGPLKPIPGVVDKSIAQPRAAREQPW
jgi:hypothetical protein